MEQIEGGIAQESEHLRSLPGVDETGVLAETDVFVGMQAVFDAACRHGPTLRYSHFFDTVKHSLNEEYLSPRVISWPFR